MFRQKTTQAAPLGIADLPSQSEEAEAAEIELRELRLIAARAEARVTCLHLHRIDRVIASLVESITDCSRRGVTATDDQWAIAHKAMMDDLVRSYLDMTRPQGKNRSTGQA